MLPDLQHEYVVRAVDASELVSAQSASAFATATGEPVPLAVGLLQAAGINHTWPFILLVVGGLLVGSMVVVGRAKR